MSNKYIPATQCTHAIKALQEEYDILDINTSTVQLKHGAPHKNNLKPI